MRLTPQTLLQTRKALGLSRFALSIASGVNPNTIAKLEWGQQSCNTRTIERLEAGFAKIQAERGNGKAA
jgi:predicted transcriptional regulator